jgi:hypothetical protein
LDEADQGQTLEGTNVVEVDQRLANLTTKREAALVVPLG